MSPIELSADEARRVALWAQGFLGAPSTKRRRSGIEGVLADLGAVQLDTISVLARSHELVPQARLGALGRDRIEGAYWGRGSSFEYWSHAACILPIDAWPLYAGRRSRIRAAAARGHRVPDPATTAVVRRRIEVEGPLTASELGGSKGAGQWWDWTPTKVAAEHLFDIGDVVCVERRGWKRVYDLAERAIPGHLLDQEPTPLECDAALVAHAGRALGVATRPDLVDYNRMRVDLTTSAIASGATGLLPALVAGWDEPAWIHPDTLAALSEGRVSGRHRTTPLSPFDSLIWDRTRTERVFGLAHRLEAYTPARKRIHGYFAMPVLAGGRLIGRIDPARRGRTLVAKQVSLRTSSSRGQSQLADALKEMASWVGCDSVVIERTDPPGLAAALTAALP